MLCIRSLSHPCLVQVCVNLEANILHQIVDVVAMVLEQIDLVRLVQSHTFAELPGLRFLNQSVFVCLDGGPDSIVFDSSVQSLLPLCHLIGTLSNELRFLGQLQSLLFLSALHERLICLDLLLSLL